MNAVPQWNSLGTGKFLTLDTKIVSALSRVAKGDLARQIINYKESEATANRAVRGRPVLLMFEHYFKTNEEAGSLYSIEDLLKMQLCGDDLSTFIHNWESVIAGLNHHPEETTLRDILLRQLRNASKLKFDLEVYDRAKEGSEQHTYEYLVKCVKELLSRDRTRKNRTAIAKAHGAKFGAPAPSEPTSTTPRGRSQDKPCYAFQRGKCPQADKCPYKHVKVEQTRGRTAPPEPHPKAEKAQEKAVKARTRRTLLKSHVCFTQRVLARMVRIVRSCTRTLVRLSRLRGMAIKAGSPGLRHPSAGAPARREARVRRRRQHAALPSPQPGVRFALAARKSDANKWGHWVVDEHKGTCTRIHQKFRTCL